MPKSLIFFSLILIVSPSITYAFPKKVFVSSLKETEQIKNIKIVDASLKTGFNDESPYDRIIIDNPIKKIDNIIYDQLSDQMGKIIMIEKIRDQLNQAYRITKNDGHLSKEYLFDVFSKYELYQNKDEFKF